VSEALNLVSLTHTPCDDQNVTVVNAVMLQCTHNVITKNADKRAHNCSPQSLVLQLSGQE